MRELKGEPMDKIETFQNTIIQHGKYNNRLFILKFPKDGGRDIIKSITKLAKSKGYSKIVAKAPGSKLIDFLKTGYKLETSIPKFYKGVEDCCFVSKFLDLDRAVYDPKPLSDFKEVLNNYQISDQNIDQSDIEIRELVESDTLNMVSVYKQVFETYPFPIFDVDYLKETMRSNVIYFGAFKKGKLLCISSSEMDIENKNAEMTDFAALPESRGMGLSKILLQAMEEKMVEKDMKTLYTIARLNSIPMNKTFLGAGYSYAGSLINNTNISGGIESMNVLYKYLSY